MYVVVECRRKRKIQSQNGKFMIGYDDEKVMFNANQFYNLVLNWKMNKNMNNGREIFV